METICSGDIKKAAEILSEGGIIGLPTETVYGLACNALNEKAVGKMYSLKGRNFNKPLSIQLDSFEKVKAYVKDVPDLYRKIADYFCPGPLTFIFDKNEIIPGITTANQKTVGIRIPDHKLALELLKMLDFPLAVSSANQSGFPEAGSPPEVLNSFKGKIPYLLDGGKCTLGVVSTVIAFSDGEIQLLRKGAISIEEIMEIIK